MIKHLWLDFSETIAVINKERHNKLRYESYAEVLGEKITPELIHKYEKLYQENKHSNAAVFTSLGMPSSYWSDRINSLSPGELYSLADENIPDVLGKLKLIVPISIFSNINLEKVLPALNIDLKLFTNILSAGMLKAPKPALDGFYKMIEISKVPANEILYIGDDVGKDVLPAKKVGAQAGLIWKSSDEADYSFKDFKDILSLFPIK